MARWKRPPRVPLSEMPDRFHFRPGEEDQLREERLAWLEQHGWSYVDYLGSRRKPQRYPSRRKSPLPQHVADEVAAIEAAQEESAE